MTLSPFIMRLVTPATDGGPGNYANQCQRDLGVGFYAPATDGGAGNVANQTQKERYLNLDYTNDSLDRSKRGSCKRVGGGNGVQVKCDYLHNGEECTGFGRVKVNGLYWCCSGHSKCFEQWPESKKKYYV